MKEKKFNTFVQNRLLGVLDNVLASVVILGLGIAIPTIVGFVLKLETQVTLLIVLMIVQILGIVLLLRIQRKLSIAQTKKHILVQGLETGEFYLIDEFGMPHLIKDENTPLYFMEILNLKPSEVPKISSKSLRPAGASITPVRDWRPPQTVENKMSFEAQRSLWFSPKYINKGNSAKAISINIRNNGDQVIQINSAKLAFNSTTPPLNVSDISPKNKPTVMGFLECTLLFDGGIPNKALSPQEESRLDLFLKESLPESELSEIIGARFGFIRMSGIFRDVSVSLHYEI